MARKIGNIIYKIGIVVLLIVAFVVVLSTLNIPGNIKILSVQSGSMEPSIHTGSVVIVKPSSTYVKGDIITVNEQTNKNGTVTHRIFDIELKDGKNIYVTKGDANNAVDLEKRLPENIIGKVVFTIPLLGYLVSFAKTREGLFILVIVPSLVIIFSELINVRDEFKKMLDKRKEKKNKLLEKKE